MHGKSHFQIKNKLKVLIGSILLLAMFVSIFSIYIFSPATDESKLIEASSEKLLKNSTTINFPNNYSFSPLKLNDKYIIGEATALNQKNDKHLAIIDLETNTMRKLQDTSRKSEFVSFIVNFADDNFIIYEEFDQENYFSTYFVWDFKKNRSQEIKHIKNVQPIHFTQVSRDVNQFYINLNMDGIYKTCKYDYSKNTFHSYEERNSSHPTVLNNKFFLIKIDNNKKMTTINQVLRKNSIRKTIRQTKREDEFYNGIFTNGKNLIFSKYSSGKICLYKSDGKEDKFIYGSDWIESLDYKNHFITFIGKKRNQNRVKSQYYIIDVKNKKNYIYDDGIVLLSNKGIIWVKFNKKENEIEKGKIFCNQNASLKYFLYREGEK